VNKRVNNSILGTFVPRIEEERITPSELNLDNRSFVNEISI